MGEKIKSSLQSFQSFQSSQLVLNFKSTQRSRGSLPALKRVFKQSLFPLETFLLKEMKFYEKGVTQVVMGLVLCGKAKMKGLNGNYRNRPYPTDVLSFPVHKNLRTLKTWTGPLELGDLFICREIAQEQAKNFQITYTQELIHLFIHGFLHLLGYDHEKGRAEAKLMQAWEDRLVEEINKRREK